MQPGALLDAGLGQECLPLIPVIVRVDGSATRLAPDQIPVLPGASRHPPLGVLLTEMRAERRNELDWIGTGRLRLPLGRMDFHPPLRCGQALA